MENLADHEADIHPQTSSSSSSAPTTPSSSSSSSSSPSHPQSFASSPSSQKELSAPSSSGSSSTSSSPFSGPSSPARAAVDQASCSAQAHTTEDDAAPYLNNHTIRSSSAGGELLEDTTPGFATSESYAIIGSKINSAAPDDGTMGSSARQDTLGASPATQAGREKKNNTLLAWPSEEPDDELSPVYNTDGDNNNTNPLAIKSNLEDLERNTTACSSEAIVQCNGSTSEDLQFAMLTNGEASGHDTDQIITANNGQMSVDVSWDRIPLDNASSQQYCDHNIEKSKSGLDAGIIVDEVSHCQGIKRFENYKLILNPDHTRNGEASQQAVEVSLESKLYPEGSDSSEDCLKSRTSWAGYPVIPKEKPLQDLVVNEAETFCFNSTEAPHNLLESPNHISSDKSELHRAKTMPSGALEVIDGVVRPGRRPSFKRSITDKAKAVKDNLSSTPGSKLSKKRQERLVKTLGTLQSDGTVEVDIEKSARFAPELFGPEELEDYSSCIDEECRGPIVPLQIAMLIVGTRGDVQPFLAIGKRLQEYGHRVRLATHSNFEEFVLKAGLEFYPLGGDPKVLAGYMVKNKGFLPSGPSEVRTQRKQLKSIIYSLLPACTCPYRTGLPFRAQAIIANPPAYGHSHVAEALKVPLHIFFTMPWTPTSEFPHPLSRVGHSAANRLSYQVVDSLIGWGIRGIINDFRKKKLKLRPVTYLNSSQQSVSKLPTGYIWSPHLVPKPKDWGAKIDVVGFCFLNLSQDYKPPDELVSWLASGPAPIYVGFGSLPVEDPSGMTKIIVEALKETSQRGIISKGWGGIGTMAEVPESVYLLDNCPHDWLFSQCAAVVHHGGAGTTAAGLKAACPTTVVPFFGDQTFWGHRVHARGVGPLPIPVSQFSLEKLVHAIRFMLNDEVKQNAIDLANAVKDEDGVEGAVAAFHKHLPKDMPKPNTEIPSKSGWGGLVTSYMLPCFGSNKS